MGNQVLSDFLAGFFSSDEQQLSTLSPLVRSVHTYSTDIVFELTPEGTVVSVNPSIEEHWHIPVADCIDVNLALIVTFDQAVADPFATNLDTTVTLVASETQIQVNSTAVQVVKHGQLIGYILFIEDLRHRHHEAECLSRSVEQANNLVRQMIPAALREKMKEENASLVYVTNWAAVLCIQIADFETFADQTGQIDAAKRYRETLDSYFAGLPNAAHFKSLGLSEYVLFEVGNEPCDPAEIARLVWQCCAQVRKILELADVKVRFGLAAEPIVTMGLMSTDTLSFDIFGKVARAARIMALKATPGVLVTDTTAFPHFPAIVGVQANQLHFNNGPVKYIGLRCEVPSQDEIRGA
jgi:class 3 adenylate cyclase